MEMMPGFSNPDVKIHIRDTLQMFVGHARPVSWARLAELTHDGEGTLATYERRLRSYVEVDGPLMPLDTFMRVFTVLPPQAFARVAARMGFSTSPLEVEVVATVRRAVAACARFAANGAEALEDGHINHVELANLSDEAMALGPVINSIAGSGSAP